jgi:site-specific recombinase XerD
MQDALNNISSQLKTMIKQSLQELLIVETVKIELMQFKNQIMAAYELTKSKSYLISIDLSFNHLIDFFGPMMDIKNIGAKEIDAFMKHLMIKVPKGYRVYYRTLKAVFQKAVDWGYAQENPFRKYKLDKRQVNKPHFITEETLYKIVERIEGKANKIGCDKNKRKSLLLIADIIFTAFYTGMRINELINLRFKNMNLSKRRITVGDEHFTTKGRKQRIIPICDKLENRLEQRLNIKNKNDEFVFGISANRTLTKDYVSKTFKQICRDLGISEEIRFHSLRHSFASHLAQQGVSPYHLKELMGHSSVTTTEIYAHLNEEVLEQAISKFN